MATTITIVTAMEGKFLRARSHQNLTFFSCGLLGLAGYVTAQHAFTRTTARTFVEMLELHVLTGNCDAIPSHLCHVIAVPVTWCLSHGAHAGARLKTD